MKTCFKFFIIIAITLFIFSFSYVHAIDMFLTNHTLDNNEILVTENTTRNATQNNEDVDANIVTNPAPTVTHSSSVSNSTLSVSDIIDIILIAICIVLIFLAIAILIRCK